MNHERVYPLMNDCQGPPPRGTDTLQCLCIVLQRSCNSPQTVSRRKAKFLSQGSDVLQRS